MYGVTFLAVYFIAFVVICCIALRLIEKKLKPKSSYEVWLMEELRRNPDYINWLKVANSGRDYKLGRRILKRIKKGGKGH